MEVKKELTMEVTDEVYRLWWKTSKKKTRESIKKSGSGSWSGEGRRRSEGNGRGSGGVFVGERD